MRSVVHRSENLTIQVSEDGRKLEYEIRFSSSSARGTSDALCPKCLTTGRALHWEIEGPDGQGNTVWMVCENEDCDGGGFRWTRPVTFVDGWVDR